MANPATTLGRLALLGLILSAAPALAAEAHRFSEGKHEKGELKYVNSLPVLIVQGTPQEIGRQQAALTTDVAAELVDYPKDFLSTLGLAKRWPQFIELGRSLLPQVPKDHLAELDAFAAASQFDRDAVLAVNTMVDVYRGGFACSSLMVDPQRSATGGPLFGRNLDFFSLGRLHKYSLVVVCRPEGKHAFVSVTFPGLFGCLSGMNDAGLALAVHEVFFSRDGSAMFDPRGTPYLFCFRRILEECTTVEEAAGLLRSTGRTTLLNLAICDRRGGAVLEITPKHVVLRRGVDGLCACTNHFRSRRLGTFALAWRYHLLMTSRDIQSIGLADVAEKLDDANLGRLTMQTMIFEPAPLVLHLAIGSCPSSALPLKPLELTPLFEAAPSEEIDGKTLE